MISIKDQLRIENLEKETARQSALIKELQGSLERLWEVARAEQNAKPKRETLSIKGKHGKA